MNENRDALHLFEGAGVEMEYAVVSRKDLQVRPIVDQILREVTGDFNCDADIDELGWSNELVLHVMEIKMINPAPTLQGFNQKFQKHVQRINEILKPHAACLMPGGMHPWMDPAAETVIWPHEGSEIYQTFNRLFNCRRHGWANLQSCQLNLPFNGDEEFKKLHAAIRFLMPLMTVLSASTPLKEGKLTGLCDTRLEVYRTNAVRIPSISGNVIPEPIYTKKEYEDILLKGIYKDIAPDDPEGTLQHEWLNARGAIARFDRNAIEIRTLDTQENPSVDLAICEFLTYTLKRLIREKWAPISELQSWPSVQLEELFQSIIKEGGTANIDGNYAFCLTGKKEKATAMEVWTAVYDSWQPANGYERECKDVIKAILTKGNLSSRIVKALGQDVSRENLTAIYNELCGCLAQGKMFRVS